MGMDKIDGGIINMGYIYCGDCWSIIGYTRIPLKDYMKIEKCKYGCEEE